METFTAEQLTAMFPGLGTADLFDVGAPHIYDAGEVLIDEGTQCDHLHLVMTGSVDVYAADVHVAGLGPGSFVGESALFGGAATTATVRTDTGCVVLSVGRPDLDALRERSPESALRLLAGLCERIAQRIRAVDARLDSNGADVPIDEPTTVVELIDVIGDDSALSDLFTIVESEPGDIIIQQGQQGRDFSIVLAGAVGIDRLGEHGSRYVAVAGAGEIVGVIGLADRQPRGGSAVAQTNVRRAVASIDAVDDLARDQPASAATLFSLVGQQLVIDSRSSLALLKHDVRRDRSPSTATTSVTSCDVVVIGAGPIGLVFAGWLKKWRPATHVVVIDRRSSPGHKVGESTLAATVRAFLAMGLDQPTLRRFFANKAGLRFFHTDADSERPERHVDVVDIEETYQVERRPLEILMQENARRQGVDIQLGRSARTDMSDVGAGQVVCDGPDGEVVRLDAKVIVDASGPASVLGRHLGVHRKDPEACGPLNYNSYFGYFRPKHDVPLEKWDYPATRHIAFPGGWVWFITVTSWEGTSDESLHAMASDLLDVAGGPDATYPSRDELIARHGGRHHQRVSIGITVRDDRDLHEVPAVDRFEALADRYPAIRWVLDHFELIDAPYEGKKRPFQAYTKMVHDVSDFAGDGWCIVGDAAAFTSPLFSPGLNYGVGHAYVAARAVVDALDSGDNSKAAFAEYEEYMRDVFDTFATETEMYYRAFDHPDSFERVLASKVVYAAYDVIEDREYGPSDTTVHAILDDRWKNYVTRHVALQRELENDGSDPSDRADATRDLVGRFLDEVNEREGGDRLDLGRFFDCWTPQGAYDPHRTRGTGQFAATVCAACSLTTDASLACCPYCGDELTPPSG